METEQLLDLAGHEPRSWDKVRWAYRSRCFRALNFAFGVRSVDAEEGPYLDHILSGLLSAEAEPEVWYSILRSADKPGQPYAVFLGSELLTFASSKAFALRLLLWQINGAAVRSARPSVVLHAGGVALNGAGAIISGPSGSGKTTLTAALVRSGFQYLTDEAVAFDPATSLLQPYPKALAIQSGSWEMLRSLRPVPSELSPKVWHVAPTDIRADAIGGPVPPSVIIFPTHDAEERGGETIGRELARSEALVSVFRQSFEVDAAPARILAVLGTLVERCRSFRVSTVDLGRAVREVTELMRLPSAGSSHRSRDPGSARGGLRLR